MATFGIFYVLYFRPFPCWDHFFAVSEVVRGIRVRFNVVSSCKQRLGPPLHDTVFSIIFVVYQIELKTMYIIHMVLTSISSSIHVHNIYIQNK